MTEEEESLNKLKYKTIETGTLEDTIEATNDNNNKNKKKKRPYALSMTDENHRNNKHNKPKKTRLTKTYSNL